MRQYRVVGAFDQPINLEPDISQGQFDSVVQGLRKLAARNAKGAFLLTNLKMNDKRLDVLTENLYRVYEPIERGLQPQEFHASSFYVNAS